jgi:hypothetical protein
MKEMRRTKRRKKGSKNKKKDIVAVIPSWLDCRHSVCVGDKCVVECTATNNADDEDSPGCAGPGVGEAVNVE